MDQTSRLPLSLDNPKKVFLWNVDETVITMLGLGASIFTKDFFYLPISLFLAWKWGQFKSGKHPWFFIHALYWYLPVPENNPRIPDTHKREFLK